MKLIIEISGEPWCHITCASEGTATPKQAQLVQFIQAAVKDAIQKQLAVADPNKRRHFWGQNNPPNS